MSIYRFSEASPVREIALHFRMECEPVAVLTASPGVDARQAQAMRKTLETGGLLCVPISKDGRDALQVTGFTDAETLLGLLNAHGYLDGQPQITPQPGDDHAQHAKLGFFKRYSLKLAGALNMMGDIGLLSKGLSGGGAFTAAAGGLYTMGGANLALFGDAKPTRSPLLDRMASYISKQAPTASAHPGLAELLRHTGSENTLNKRLMNNTANITLAAYSAGAATMLAQGVREFREERVKLASGEIDRSNTKGWSLIGYGVSSLAFKLLSLLIPEKTQEELDATPRSGVRKCVDWVREKPLRLFGYGSLITDAMLAIRGFQEYKASKSLPAALRSKKEYLWTALTTVTYMASDFFAAISSKNQSSAGRKLNPDERRGALAIAAEAIALQPLEKQAALTRDVAEFLGTQPEMGSDKTDFKTALRHKIESLRTSPWALRVQETDAAQGASLA